MHGTRDVVEQQVDQDDNPAGIVARQWHEARIVPQGVPQRFKPDDALCETSGCGTACCSGQVEIRKEGGKLTQRDSHGLRGQAVAQREGIDGFGFGFGTGLVRRRWS